MTRIFLSHSHKDNAAARAFKLWLTQEGWADEDVFLDLDNLEIGAVWKDALRRANRKCEAVVFLASPDSLASSACHEEIRTAEELGKELLVLILRDLEVSDPRLLPFADRHILRLDASPRDATFSVQDADPPVSVAFHKDTLRKVKSRLQSLGLAPDQFVWRPCDTASTASPYPGLEGFSTRDAGIFFGRTADTTRTLSEIRRIARQDRGAVLAITAASGAGKSSFLNAGIWPRLLRDDAFLPLAILRPGTGAISGPNGLIAALTHAFEDMRIPRPPKQVQAVLEQDSSIGLGHLIGDLRAAATQERQIADPDATAPFPIIAIDQAEELFGTKTSLENETLLRLLSPALSSDAFIQSNAPFILLLTIRADSVDAMMRSMQRIGIDQVRTLPLPLIPNSAYRDIIMRPAEVARKAGIDLTIDEELADAIVSDAQGADALPLVAFALKQLVESPQPGRSLKLTLSAYHEMGGTAGALAHRLDTVRSDTPTKGFDNALKSLLLPHLATWDADAVPPAAKRLIASDTELFGQAREGLRPLAEALVDARLLTRGHGTFEVAHESLLRIEPIAGWLEEDRAFLAWRSRLIKDRQAHNEQRRGLLVGRELELAQTFLGERSSEISSLDTRFIRESIASDERQKATAAEQLARTQSAKRRSNIAMIGALIVALVGSIGILIQQNQIANDRAKAAEQLATMETDRAKEIERLLQQRTEQEQRTVAALETAIRAQQEADESRSSMQQAMSRLWADLAEEQLAAGHPLAALGLARASEDPIQGTIWREGWGSSDILRPDGLPFEPVALAALQTSLRGYVPISQIGDPDEQSQHLILPELRTIVEVSPDGMLRTFDAATGDIGLEEHAHDTRVAGLSASPDGTHFLTYTIEGSIKVWDAETGTLRASHIAEGFDVGAAWFSDAGNHLLFIVKDDSAAVDVPAQMLARTVGLTLWDYREGSMTQIAAPGVVHFDLRIPPVRGVQLLPGGTRIYADGSLFDAGTGDLIANFQDVFDQSTSYDVSQDGRYLALGTESTYRIFETQTGQQVGDDYSFDGLTRGAWFNESGDQFLIQREIEDSHTIYAIQLETNQAVPLLEGEHRFWHSADLALSSTGASLLNVDEPPERDSNPSYSLWDMRTASQLDFPGAGDQPVVYARFIPQSRYVEARLADGTILVWDSEDLSILTRLPVLHEEVEQRGVVHIAPELEKILTQNLNGEVVLWDYRTGSVQQRFEHSESVQAAQLHENGKWLLTLGETIRLWDVATGQELFASGTVEPVSTASFGFSGTEGAIYFSVMTPSISSSIRTLEIWGPGPGQGHVMSLPTIAQSDSTPSLFDIGWNLHGPSHQFVRLSSNQTVVFYQAATHQLTRIESPFNDGLSGTRRPINVGDRLEFSSDGRQVMFQTNLGIILASLDTQSSEFFPLEERPLTGWSQFSVEAFFFDETDSPVVITRSDTMLELMNLRSGSVVAQDVDHAPTGLSNDPVNGLIAIGTYAGVQLWDPADNERFVLDADFVPDFLQFSRDGSQLMGVAPKVLEVDNFGIRVWDIASGIATDDIQTPTANVGHADFSPDGRSIILLRGFQVEVLDLETSTFFELPDSGHLVEHPDAAFSQDGTQILVGDRPDGISVWPNLEPRKLHEIASDILDGIEPFSQLERCEFFLPSEIARCEW